MEKTDIRGLTLSELETELTALGEKPFRARQVYQWLHQKLVTDYGQMSNLPRKLRETLADHFSLAALEAVDMRVSQIDGTRKYLFRLADGNVIESVWMRYHHGNSVCISSQVGCRMGCRFCASTLDGLERNLTAAEMLDQVYRIQALTGERVSNVVVMGSGEPLDNYDNLLRFIKLLGAPEGLNISQRAVTVSTCGIVPGIRRLAEERLQITLALSLHAPDDETRRQLMPIANRYALEDVMAACRDYFVLTGRRVTYEYSLVRGVNDDVRTARALAGLLSGAHGHVNLIPVNPIRERDYVQSDQRSIQAFKNQLERSGIPATVRREMGRDINGACGQLRRSFLREEKQEEGE
ncbi:MAG: 23S rRNA (adenine(2503)-C(2))-methyltransferase RlmN [Clostridiales bacterium]|nr:23S rRNA (adenine(2503)-C(2))-methyltransferase RlmN [Clostridiales bacterium]